MKSFEPIMKVLPEAQQKIWSCLGASLKMKFVLYGGTAIALQLGHRTSIDFDFFSTESLNRQELEKHFSFFPKSIILQDQPQAITLLTPPDDNGQSVKISYFGGIDFGRVGNPMNSDDGIMQIASLDDLMAHKLKVVLQRSEAKDYQDIAAMIQAGVSLEKGLASARILYGPAFQPSESLKACVYFKDGDLNTLSATIKQSLVQAVGQVSQLPTVSLLSEQLFL